MMISNRVSSDISALRQSLIAVRIAFRSARRSSRFFLRSSRFVRVGASSIAASVAAPCTATAEYAGATTRRLKKRVRGSKNPFIIYWFSKEISGHFPGTTSSYYSYSKKQSSPQLNCQAQTGLIIGSSVTLASLGPTLSQPMKPPEALATWRARLSSPS